MKEFESYRSMLKKNGPLIQAPKSEEIGFEEIVQTFGAQIPYDATKPKQLIAAKLKKKTTISYYFNKK